MYYIYICIYKDNATATARNKSVNSNCNETLFGLHISLGAKTGRLKIHFKCCRLTEIDRNLAARIKHSTETPLK